MSSKKINEMIDFNKDILQRRKKEPPGMSAIHYIDGRIEGEAKAITKQFPEREFITHHILKKEQIRRDTKEKTDVLVISNKNTEQLRKKFEWIKKDDPTRADKMERIPGKLSKSQYLPYSMVKPGP